MGVDMLGSKRKGLFGAIPMPGIISGYGGGTWNMDGTQATPVDRGGFEVPTDGGPSLPEAAPTPKKGGGFFGSDGLGTSILGAVGDYLMQVNGMQPTFGNAQLLRRQMELQQQRAQQQRQAELEDYATKLRMKQQIDPDKPSQTSLQQNYDWLVSMGRKKEADDLIARMTSNITWRQGPDGQFYPMQVQTPPSITDEDWNSAAPAGGGAGYGQQGFRP